MFSRIVFSLDGSKRQMKKRKFKQCNAQMDSKMLKEVCDIDEAGNKLLQSAMDRLKLSARAYDRILKVARTIADWDRSEHIRTEHLSEAIQYRSLDRENWAG
jgi:magnesium chelatase family protein